MVRAMDYDKRRFEVIVGLKDRVAYADRSCPDMSFGKGFRIFVYDHYDRSHCLGHHSGATLEECVDKTIGDEITWNEYKRLKDMVAGLKRTCCGIISDAPNCDINTWRMSNGLPPMENIKWVAPKRKEA